MRTLESFPDADLRVSDRPPLPSRQAVRHVELVGICGKRAHALAADGFAVEGSDAAVV